MSSFDDGFGNSIEGRGKAFEDKFAHDEELRFRTEASARHAFGLWVAQQAGMKPDEAEAYARTLGDNLARSEAEVTFMAQGDLTGRGIHLSDHAIETAFETCRAAARDRVMTRA